MEPPRLRRSPASFGCHSVTAAWASLRGGAHSQPHGKCRIHQKERFPTQLLVESGLQTTRRNPVVDKTSCRCGERTPAQLRGKRSAGRARNLLLMERGPPHRHQVMNRIPHGRMAPARASDTSGSRTPKPLTGSIDRPGGRAGFDTTACGECERGKNAGDGAADCPTARSLFPAQHDTDAKLNCRQGECASC
jgi:hypothetical protein